MRLIDRLRKEGDIYYKRMSYTRFKASLLKEGFTKEIFEGYDSFVNEKSLVLYTKDELENVRIFYSDGPDGRPGAVTDVYYHDYRPETISDIEDILAEADSPDKEINGWKNYETWSVWMDLENVENIYFMSKEWADEVRKKKRPSDYKNLMIYIGCTNKHCTQNGTYFMSPKVDRKAIIKAVLDLDR